MLLPRTAGLTARLSSKESLDTVAGATRRCLQRFVLPQHSYVDGEAWRTSQILNKFVGAIGSYQDLTECVNDEADLHAYGVLGVLRTTWDGLGLLGDQTTTHSAQTSSGRLASPTR